MYRIALFTLLISIAASVQAEVQYWVAVGSFSERANAEQAMDQAREQLAENFAVIGASTSVGYYYRVGIGPFMNRELAQDRLQAAKTAGFASAWLWADDSSTFADSYTPLPDPVDEFPQYTPVDDAIYSAPRSYDGEAPLGNDEDIMRRQEVPELVEDAPESFKLNKLRRDAQARPPPRQPDPATPGSVPPANSTPATSSPPTQLLIDLNAGDPINLLKFDESQISMTIDGRLDEPVWGQFPGVDQFLVVDPDTVAVPRHNTVVKMFYTDRGLYASFVMEQPPITLVRRYSGRDEGRLNRDSVGITIDTSGEGRYGYWVNLALGGNQIDGTVLPERQFSGDWDGAWYGGTTETDTGWNAEIFLPWSQVAMPKQVGQRTVNAYASRKVAYLNERWAVPALPFTQPLFMSALQPLVLDAVDPRQQWSLFPFASVTQDKVEDFTKAKMGVDLFWRPSTNFQMTATLNPDFGNVESDDVIVNLSAFETFFPEKRLFFQESTEVFSTTPRAKSGNPTTLLNTRRIGGRPRGPNVPDDVTVANRELGQPTELVGAAKVVGQFGKARYGVLLASEDEIKFDVDAINYYQDGSDYAIARILFEDKGADGSYRAAGAMSTLATHPDQDAIVHGVDMHYLSNGGDWKFDTQFLYSDKDDVGHGTGGFVDVGYAVKRGFNLRLGLSHFDDKLDINDLGFIRRNDATNLQFNADYSRSDLSWVRKASVNGFVEYEVNGDDEQTRRGLGTRLGFDLHNGDQMRLGLAYFPERDEDRNSRDNGTYTVEARHQTSLDYFTDSSRKISYHLGLAHNGEELGGENLIGRLGVNWRPIARINVGAYAEYLQRDGWLLWQEDRNFTTFESSEWRPRINMDYFVTAKQQIRFSAQWVGIKSDEQEFYVVPDRPGELLEVSKPVGPTDDFTISRVNLQLRYRWEIAPLSELFIVYTLNGESNRLNQGFEDLFSDALDQPVGEQLVVKLRYRLGS